MSIRCRQWSLHCFGPCPQPKAATTFAIGATADFQSHTQVTDAANIATTAATTATSIEHQQHYSSSSASSTSSQTSNYLQPKKPATVSQNFNKTGDYADMGKVFNSSACSFSTNNLSRNKFSNISNQQMNHSNNQYPKSIQSQYQQVKLTYKEKKCTNSINFIIFKSINWVYT
jgi:hypothetical protein